MKKKSFGLVLLISLLIIVIGFYVFVNSVLNKNDGVEDGGNSDIVYIDKQEDDVEKVTYNDGSSSFTIKKSANVYLLTEDEDFPVNETAASFVFNSVARIVFERRFKVDNSALAEYGLVDAHRVLNVTYVNGARLTLTIGAYNEYAGAYYCSVGDGFVYLIDSEFADAFEYTYADLLQDDTVEAPQNGFTSLKSIEIKGPSGTVVLAPTENGEDWTKRIVGGNTEEGYILDAQHIYTQLFINLQVDEWVEYSAYDDESRDRYGLKGPEIRVIFNHVEKVEISVEGSSTVTKEYDRTTTFLIGKTLASEGEDEEVRRYFMFGDGSVVYVIDEESFSSVIDILK